MPPPLRLLLLTLLLCLSASAPAADQIRERAWVDDPTATLTLADVQRLPQSRFDGVLSRGFTRSATWLRLRIDGRQSARPGDQLIVRIRPVYLDQIALFDPLDPLDPLDTSGRARIAGDHVDWHASEFKSLNHGFVIPAATEARDIWLRLVTSSSSLIHVEVLTPDDAQQANRLQELLYGLMMGVLLLFFLWALLHWLLHREALMAAFMFSQLLAIVYAATYVGYNRLLLGDLFDNDALERASSVIFCSYVAAGILFHLFFVREFKPGRLALWLIGLVAGLAYLAELALLASGNVQAAMRTNITVVSLSPIIIFIAACRCRAWAEAGDDEQPPIPKWSLVGFYGLMIGLMWIATLPALGLADAPELNLHVYLIHGLMTGALLVVLLQFRAMRLEESRNLAALRARSASQQVEIEKQKAQLQTRFMEMLAHELKTSLSVLHMVFGAPKPNPEMLEHGRRTVRSINDLIERCLQAEKFDDKEIISHFENFHVDAVIDDILVKLPDAARIAVVSESQLTVNSDWQIFKSVLSNLIDNALKYSLPGSKIQVRVRSAENKAVRGCEISIENEVATGNGGSGFPDPAELFKKYYRAGSARKHSGSGLGLYLVANFMRLLGGEVRYEPSDRSVRFIVWLPN
jgi:signal transduction histidine kinase